MALKGAEGGLVSSAEPSTVSGLPGRASGAQLDALCLFKLWHRGCARPSGQSSIPGGSTASAPLEPWGTQWAPKPMQVKDPGSAPGQPALTPGLRGCKALWSLFGSSLLQSPKSGASSLPTCTPVRSISAGCGVHVCNPSTLEAEAEGLS